MSTTRPTLQHSSSYGHDLNQLSSSTSSTRSTLSNGSNGNNNNMSGSGNSLLSLIPPSLIKQYDNDVVQLFEKNMPEQMKTIESNTRYEIEEKKRQLRRLIGNKYRDLVEGSDSIVKMKKSCQSIQDNIKQMQSSLKSFSEQRTRNNHAATSDQVLTGNDLALSIAIISRDSKFLIEISERIWRAIDRSEFFEAEVQFLKARHLYRKLTEHPEQHPPVIQELIAKLPIVDTHWHAIQQFPQKTVQCAKEFLKKGNLTIEQYIGSLSTLILFDEHTISQTLNEFLQARLSLLIGQLERGIKFEQPVKITIHKMFESIKTTLLYLYLVFYQSTETLDNNVDLGVNNNNPKLSFTSSILETSFTWCTPYLNDALVYLDQVDKGSERSSQWENDGKWHSDQTQKYHIQKRFIHQKSLEWFEQVITKTKEQAKSLFEQVRSAKELSQLRVEVFEELSKFKQNIDVYGFNAQQHVMNWKQLINLVTDRDSYTSLIDMFEELFLLKAEVIIESTFTDINLTSLLGSRLQAMRSEDKDYGEYLWSYHEDPVLSIKNKTNGITPVAEAFLSHISQLYTGCIGDFLNLFPADKDLVTASPTSNTTGSSINSPSLNNSFSSPSGLESRSRLLAKKQHQSQAKSIVEKYEMKENELREFMRKSFYNSIRLFCQNNQQSITKLYTNKTPTSLQEVLFISKLSKLFYKHILQNPNQFIVPSASSTNSPNASLSTRSSTLNNNSNNNNSETALTTKVVDYLKEIYYIGFIVWIESILPSHCKLLQQRLNNESWDNSQQLSRAWEKHMIQDNTNNGQTQIYIPYQPSPFILSLLFEISLETNKISFNTLDKNIQRYLSISLANKIYTIIDTFINEKSSNFITICKEGYLQLYLDMKYLNVVLFGNKKIQPIKDIIFNNAKTYFDTNISMEQQQPTAAESQQQQMTMKTMSDVISLLEEKIDPIELILYKEYAAKFVEASYNRTTTLFGCFTKSHRSIIKSELKSTSTPGLTIGKGSNESPNTMPLAKSNVKFQLFSVESIPSMQTTLSSPSATPKLPAQHLQKKHAHTPLQPQNSGIPNTTNTRPISNTPSPASAAALASQTYSLMEQMSKKIQQNIPSVLTNIGK